MTRPDIEARAEAATVPPKSFTTDGCSGGMSWLWHKFEGDLPPWQGACVDHDRAYWMGGTKHARWRADRLLFHHVRQAGCPIWANLIYAAIRIGGVFWLPTPWRWGYGWPWPRSGP